MGRRMHWRRTFIILLLLGLLFGIKHHCPRPAAVFQQWLVGEQDNQVIQAFSALSGSMEQGDGLGAAVEAFCAGGSSIAES